MPYPESLLELLQQNAQHGRLPMHMPGHKRAARLPYLQALQATLDVTEIEGFDNLHHATGILQTSMQMAANLWGSADCYYLVNGSTCGILAAVRAAAKTNTTVLMARNCHQSVYHAIEINALHPVYLQPQAIAGASFAGSILPQDVEEALCKHSVSLVILTSPTYEGVCSDVAAIGAICHAHGVPLLVDAAHGAHFRFSDAFPQDAVQAGADLVVQSVHKTLPSLTQTALLHRQGDFVTAKNVAQQLRIFETSSPSYLLMASIDGCVRWLAQDSKANFATWHTQLMQFYKNAATLRRLKVWQPPLAQSVFAWDQSKIIISAAQCGWGGERLAAFLRSQAIEPEMVTADYILCMTSPLDDEQTLQMFFLALQKLDAALPDETQSMPIPTLPLLPIQACTPLRATESEREHIAIAHAAGRVLAEYIWAYPPGIPLAVPGEVLGQAQLASILALLTKQIEVYSSENGFPHTLCVVKPCENQEK